ncbi:MULTISPECIES: hypothetical protein [Brevibacillus]|nr:hypothetical protein [Brevibacillus borstelensis]MED1884498.1 hypothetical protein [Brevibacillus borstelensis]GED52598.1 hypothetical protein BBO01nite_18390 [Brevibacillus borstelensis]
MNDERKRLMEEEQNDLRMPRQMAGRKETGRGAYGFPKLYLKEG